jgi:hypothetical protein
MIVYYEIKRNLYIIYFYVDDTSTAGNSKIILNIKFYIGDVSEL